MDDKTLQDWLDRHHVDVVRTFATTLDGAAVGKYVHRSKFAKSLPQGHAIADVAPSMDLTGSPHLTFWHPDRTGGLGDMYLRPDLSTLISDGTDANLGHCMCDFTTADGKPFDLCTRSLLRRMLARLGEHGYSMKATFELEFYLYQDSFEEIRRKQYRHLNPVTTSRHSNIYILRNAYPATRFMSEVISRLEWKGIAWEGWNDENGVGQFEFNLEPTDPLTAADNLMRTRQIMYEVAKDMEMAVTFMAMPLAGFGSGMHIHHSLLDADGATVFHDASAAHGRSALMEQWIAGQLATMPAAVSFLCPSINAFRRMRDFAAVPVTPDWGNDNKTTAIRTLSHSPGATRVEHRLASGDVNPYLALAVLTAGGLAGIESKMPLKPEFTRVAWGLPAAHERLPNTMTKALDALAEDTLLRERLGTTFVDYWGKSRKQEWLLFHTEGGDPASKDVSQWEYERYFDLI